MYSGFYIKTPIFRGSFTFKKDRLCSVNDRVFSQDRILSVRIVYFQSGSYTFSPDRILWQDRILCMIVKFTFHDRILYH